MSPSAPRLRRSRSPRYALWASLLVLSACGGGGSGGGSTSTTPPAGWTAGVFQPSSHYAAQCQNPRSGTDPVSGVTLADAEQHLAAIATAA